MLVCKVTFVSAGIWSLQGHWVSLPDLPSLAVGLGAVYVVRPPKAFAWGCDRRSCFGGCSVTLDKQWSIDLVSHGFGLEGGLFNRASYHVASGELVFGQLGVHLF